MASDVIVPELRMGIRYEVPAPDAEDEVLVRDAILRKLGSVGVVVQDEAPPRVGERLTFVLDTPEGALRFGAQVIVRLRGPGGSPWGFGAQMANIDAATAGRLLALRLAAGGHAAASLQ